jgi:hypothetical protein
MPEVRRYLIEDTVAAERLNHPARSAIKKTGH